MNSIYNLFKSYSSSNQKKYIRNHKLRNVTLPTSKDNHLITYNELVYQLYKLKMSNSNNLEKISKIELEIAEYVDKYNINNIEKIEATLLAMERYYDELRLEEELEIDKKRGIIIYEDLSYKLHKATRIIPCDQNRINKLKNKLNNCANKYNLESIDKINAQLKAELKYNEFLSRQEANKRIGLSIYNELVTNLYKLKQKESKNKEKINQIESKIKKCSNKYNLSNIDKLDIQLKVLEKIV